MRLKRRKAREIEALYRQHGSALLLFAAAITGELERARDAVQLVFLTLIQDDRLQGVVDTKAYLFASVRNAVLNEVRIERRNVALDPNAAWFDPPKRDYSAEINLRHALAALPEEQRQVVVLHIWGELTFQQVAELLNISANTAASRYRYALSKLREAMCGKEDSRAIP